MRRTHLWTVCALFVAFLGTVSAEAAEYYASPSGSSTGSGAIGSPWDLQTAFNKGYPANTVQPGDTIWLRGGNYNGFFTCRLAGASGNPIVVRQYPGERATLRGSTTSGQASTLYIAGSYVWLRDFEITAAGTDRISTESTSWPTDIDYAGGVNTGNNSGEGAGCKLINLVVHDTCQALSLWIYATDFETSGCVVYHNGWDAPDRGHGHGIYTQNNTGVKTFKDNILFGGFSYGTQAYGSGSAYVNNYLFEGNTYFDAGVLSAVSGGSNLLIGGGRPSENITANRNMIYRTGVDGDALRLGYGWVSAPNVNCTARENYLAGQLQVNNYQTMTVRDNTIIAETGLVALDIRMLPSQPPYDWDNNHYYCRESAWSPFGYYTAGGNYGLFFPGWKTQTGLDAGSSYVRAFPGTEAVFVRASAYDSGRANITIFNWPQSNNVSVDVSSVLANGDSYEVIDAQNYFGALIASGAYAGGTISIPMTGTTASQPTGNAPLTYTHTSKQFGAFILRRTAAAPGPPSAPTGLAATDGTYADKVSVTWDAVGGATSYKVFRNTTNNSATASQIGAPSSNSYDDTTAAAGTTYYYWAKATNSHGDSDFSNSDTGYRMVAPSTPTGLSATDGTYASKVRVSWNASAGAASYKVFRNTVDDSGTATQIGAPTPNSYDDTTAAVGTTYYYWVKATNAAGDSGFSNSDSGYRSTEAPYVQYMEAEAGTLAGPMTTSSDPTASGGVLIYTPTAQSGTAQYTIGAPSGGDYVVWGRVYCPDGNTDSYFVSVDGGAEDVYDMAEGIWAAAWQWTVVNGRGGGAADSIHPRIFTLTAGEHTFTFRGREANAKLDRLCFTNDLDYVPFDANTAPTAVDDAGSTTMDLAIIVDVLDNDTDPEGDTLTVESVTTPAHGEATINLDNTVTYTPEVSFVGEDTFDYTISDGKDGSDAATVTVTVEAPPVTHTLTVQSRPISDIAIGGISGGMTTYSMQCSDGDWETLVAPSAVVRARKTYYFVRWTIDSVSQPAGQTTVSFAVTTDTTVVAVYRNVRLVKIYGPSALFENTRKSYRATAFFTEGASKNVTNLASWADNTVYLRFVRRGVLQAGSVSSTLTRRITATYGGVTGRFSVTIRNR